MAYDSPPAKVVWYNKRKLGSGLLPGTTRNDLDLFIPFVIFSNYSCLEE
jgi:hypothetical protein